MLKNENLFNDSVKEQQEFQQFLKDFLKDYEHIERYGIYEPLMATFLEVLKFEKENKTKSDDKFQQIVKENFSVLLQEYENNYKKLLKEKFQNNFENLMKQLSPEDLKQMPLFTKTIEKIKSCDSYHCYPTNNHLLLLTINVNYDLIDNYKKTEMKKCLMYFLMQIDYVSKEILKNENLSQLSFEIKQNFIQNINDFIKNFENSKNIEMFMQTNDAEKLYFLQIFYKKCKYYNRNKKFSSNDCTILKEILTKFYFDNDNVQTKYNLAKDDVIKSLVNRIISFQYYLNDKLSKFF